MFKHPNFVEREISKCCFGIVFFKQFDLQADIMLRSFTFVCVLI